jgi:integrase
MARRNKRERRERGSGSVWQDRTTGQWWAAYEDEEGAYRRHRAASREAAEAILSDIARKKQAKIRIAGGAQSLRDFLNDWFNQVVLPRLANGELKPRTIEHYQQMIELYILPALGHYRLDAITIPDVLQFRNDLAGDVSAQTTRLALRVLRQALTVAVQWRYLEHSPADAVKSPRVVTVEQEPLSLLEARALLRATEGHRLAVLFQMALTLGLRLGELLGLRWADIDWAAGTLRITQQVQGRGAPILVAPKTAASVRTIPLPPLLLAALKRHWELQLEERALLRADWKEHGLVFPSSKGTIKSPRNLERDFYGFRTRAGLSDAINFHLLRHTVATWLTEEVGATDATQRAILGHGKKNITQRYTHALRTNMCRALVEIEGLLWAAEQEIAVGS